jgi:tetratricopeptide (TPR) repeat protein
LLAPAAGHELEVARKLAQTAAKTATNDEFWAWSPFVAGLAYYRSGRFAGAADWMEQALAKAGSDPARDADSYMVLAMAQHQLEQTDAARVSLSKGAEIVQSKLPSLSSGDLGEKTWQDVLIANILLREAKALIEAPSRTAEGK